MFDNTTPIEKVSPARQIKLSSFAKGEKQQRFEAVKKSSRIPFQQIDRVGRKKLASPAPTSSHDSFIKTIGPGETVPFDAKFYLRYLRMRRQALDYEIEEERRFKQLRELWHTLKMKFDTEVRKLHHLKNHLKRDQMHKFEWSLSLPNFSEGLFGYLKSAMNICLPNKKSDDEQKLWPVNYRIEPLKTHLHEEASTPY